MFQNLKVDIEKHALKADFKDLLHKLFLFVFKTN